MKYPIKRIIGVQYKDIWPTVHTNTENTILHTNHNFDVLKSTFSCECNFSPQNICTRQNAGIFIIPIDTRCDPSLVDLFLYLFEADFSG